VKKGKGIACSLSANHLPDPNVLPDLTPDMIIFSLL
jgi:hypothetical protein